MPKKYNGVFKIGEVAELLGVKPYVIRYWETEFPHIAPKRTQSKQRLYSEEMVEQIRTIQYLLHEQGLTIEGARKALEAEKVVVPATQEKTESNNATLISELEELRTLLLKKETSS